MNFERVISIDWSGAGTETDTVDLRVAMYESKTDKFSIPPDLAKNNAETINYPKPKRK